VSSNGYEKDKKDLDVYAFKRKDLNNWSSWTGPWKIVDANSEFDDWGYKETSGRDAYVASVTPLGFKPSQGGKSGDGGIFETNFRPGYDLHGLQTASLNAEHETNIYLLKLTNKPSFIVNDVYFEFNSYLIDKSFVKYLELIVDQIKLNPSNKIEINGYTDDQGNNKYNLDLSLKRAEQVRDFLRSSGINNLINLHGFGAENPIIPNTTSENRKRNRRVEIFLIDNHAGK
jgi:outer membrane protein OmpA-like peptidoglycan-associated protein